jgi:hypothetical protein
VNVYYGSSSGIDPTPHVLHGPAGSVQFGLVVSSLGDVNGDGHDDLGVNAIVQSGGTQTAALLVYHGHPGPISVTPSTVIANPSVHSADPARWDCFGQALTGGADLDGDGYDDVVVGAPGSASVIGLSGDPYPGQGFVYVYRGSANGLLPSPRQTLSSPAPDGGWIWGYGAFGAAIAH